MKKMLKIIGISLYSIIVLNAIVLIWFPEMWLLKSFATELLIAVLLIFSNATKNEQ